MSKLIALKMNKEFKRVFYRGKSAVFPAVVVYCNKNRRKNNRLGISVSKKIGCAVKRNRAKRVIREAYLSVIDSVDNSKCCYDFVIVARNRCVYQKSTEVAQQINKALKKIGLIKND